MSMSVADSSVVREGFPKSTPRIPDHVLHQFSMDGRVAVVTGAASGIGFAVTEAICEAGGRVAMWYHTNDTAVKKAEELSQRFSTVITAYRVDVTDVDAVQRTITTVVEDFGKIDVFVANAGTVIGRPILEQTLEDYRAQLSVNVDGVVYCAKYIGELFKRQGRGNFIITSSISASIVNVPSDQPVYNGTKAFVTQFGKCLAREWRDFARVNIVSPGYFDTKMGPGPEGVNEVYRMTPLGRIGDPKEIKALYLYLASDASTYMTGSEVLIDGGYVLP